MLLAATVSPARAQGEHGGESATPVVGDFALGDGIEAAIDPRDGSLGFTMHVGGLAVRWDSRALGADPHGLGAGLSWELGRIDTVGGVRVRPSSSNEAIPVDTSHPSGLAGYGVQDVVFEQVAGALPARPVGAVRQDSGTPGDPVAFEYVLHELGGMDTYFDAQGEPVARVDVFGAREEWRWDAHVPHRLIAHVDPDGVSTELDWESEPGALVVRPAANLVAPADDGEDPDAGARGAVWRVELDAGRAAGIVDPVGGRTRFEYDESTGLVVAAGGPAGGATHVGWRIGADTIARVERVVMTDASGAELSTREWRPVGEPLPSGWPRYGGEHEVFRSGDSAFRSRTVMTDGATRVVSDYNALHTLVARRMVVTTPSGEREVQEQTLTYPGTDDGGVPDPAALPANWSRPTLAEVTVRDQYGGSRTTTEATEFDEVGRLISRTDPDGTVTLTEYDQDVAEGRHLPMGLAVSETVRAPDGEARVTTHSLDTARASVLATEVSSVPADALAAPLVVDRSEFEVASDGRVTEQRVFPAGDRDAEPNVTRSDEIVDLAAGTRTVTETVGVGTDAEATSVEVTSLITGEVLAVVDPLGNTDRVRHDRLGRAILATDASGRVTTVTYESAQEDGRNATAVRTPDGVERTEIRDELGRVIRLTDNVDRGRATDGHVRVAETREYPEPGVTSVTDAWGATTTTREDVFGRVIESIAPTGLVQLTSYDDVANTITTALTPTGSLADAELVNTERIDDAGRTVETSGTRADGTPVSTTRSSYDGFGRPLRIENDAIAETHEFDRHGRRVRTLREPLAPNVGRPEGALPTAEPGGAIVADQRFDLRGNGVEKILSDEVSSRSGGSREVDALGRTAATADQYGRVSTNEFTVDGLVAGATTANGQRTELRYDDVRRVLVGATVESPVGATVRLEYEFDPVTDAVLAVFDPEDRAGTAIAYESDAWGNPTSVTYPDGRRVRARYDEHGRRIGGVDVAGNVTELGIEPDGRVTRVLQRDASGTLLAEVTYDYDMFGRVSAIDRGNGVRTEFAFTSASAIAGERTTLHGAPQTERSYAYDTAGRLTRRTDTDSTERAPVSVTTTYGYDAHGRLVRSAEHAGADDHAPETRRTTYELTVSNDVRAETVLEQPGTADATCVRREFEYSPLGELSAITTTTGRRSEAGAEGHDGGDAQAHDVRRDEQRYDSAGNLVAAADGATYEYDAANRPIAEARPDGTTVMTDYWADGTRRSRTRSGGPHAHRAAVTTFYWDGDVLLNDVHSGAETGTATYLIAGTRHARTVTPASGVATTGYFVTDRHGSVRELTGADGTAVERYRYADYGAPTSDQSWEGLRANPFGFAGEQTHDSGTQHLSTRSYDPWTMRFTTLDTAELHNLYAYADANPVTRIDPSGRAGIEDLGHWALTLFGIAAGIVSAVSMVMTAGSTMAAVGIVVATAFDALVSVSNTVNEQHVEFMPTSTGFVLGFIATAAALLTANWMKRGRDALTASPKREVELQNFAALGDAPPSSRRPFGELDDSARQIVVLHMLDDFVTQRLANKDISKALTNWTQLYFVEPKQLLGIMNKWRASAENAVNLTERTNRFALGYLREVSRRGIWVELERGGQDRLGLPPELVVMIRERALRHESTSIADPSFGYDAVQRSVERMTMIVLRFPEELNPLLKSHYEEGLTMMQDVKDLRHRLDRLEGLRYPR